MTVLPVAFRSIHAQYSRPRCAPFERSVSQAGYTRARRTASAGMPISNGITLGAIVRCASQVTPPSKERLNAITFAEKSFQATNSVPSGPTNGTAPIEFPGPLGLSRSEEHTSELQSLAYLVCRLLLEKKKIKE